MANFNTAYDITMGHEGGYSNHPNDTGGETIYGISRKNWPKWGGWPIVDQIKRQVGTSTSAINKAAGGNTQLRQLVRDFYKAQFWDVNRLDQVKYQTIANELFDTGVNMGTGVAARFLQEALNLCNRNGQSYPDIAVDGKIGPQTLGVLNDKANEQVVFNTLNLLQGERYLNIMRNNKSQEVFWAGWLKRIMLR